MTTDQPTEPGPMFERESVDKVTGTASPYRLILNCASEKLEYYSIHSNQNAAAERPRTTTTHPMEVS